jgi:hypothetical protein
LSRENTIKDVHEFHGFTRIGRMSMEFNAGVEKGERRNQVKEVIRERERFIH